MTHEEEESRRGGGGEGRSRRKRKIGHIIHESDLRSIFRYIMSDKFQHVHLGSEQKALSDSSFGRLT